MKELRDVIASNISALRTERKMTQFQLAEILNYSDKAVSKWERGESVPDVIVLKQIADYFGVSVDYLLSEDHEQYNKEKVQRDKYTSRNKLIITLLAEGMVWLLATYVFVQILIAAPTAFPAWLSFIYALPVSAVVLLVFNSIWGRKKFNYVIISVLTWVVLVCIHLSFLKLAALPLGLIYLLGIPAQIIIILWSGLKRVKGVM